MWFRRRALGLVQHWVFEAIIMTLIVASSVALCFEDIYLEQKPYLTDFLHYLNIFFATTFTAEMGLKIVAFGFWQYFTNFWTLLDFFIVVISLTVLAADEVGQGFVAFRGLRTLRALRPLRAISRWEGMKVAVEVYSSADHASGEINVVVNALMHAIPSILNVIFVCLVFWLVFAIMGVELFAGKFYECLDDDGETLPVNIVQNKTECLEKNFTWVNAKINFDNVGMAYIALFQVATFEGWLDIVEDAMDSRGVDQQPVRDNNQYASIYFVIFIICGSFFTLNLFIGVIIDNFNALKKKVRTRKCIRHWGQIITNRYRSQYEGRALEMLLTESQKHYYAALKKLSRKRPQRVIRRPRNKYQAWFYDLSMSRKFVCVGTHGRAIPVRFEMVIFALIFANMVVMAIEHYGMSEKSQEMLEYCNISFIFLFTLGEPQFQGGNGFTFSDFEHLEACMKLVGLRYWYFTVPWNIFDFIILCLSSVAVMLDKMRSFSFPLNPVLLRVTRIFRVGRVLRLIRAAKGIRKLLFALAISLPALLNIGALLLLITFVYAILGMALFGHVAHNGAITPTTNFETFSRSMFLLFRFDPHATQFIHFNQLSDFLSDIEPPLQIKKPNLLAMVYFDLPICRGNKVHCLDALHALVTHVLGEVDETEELKTTSDACDERECCMAAVRNHSPSLDQKYCVHGIFSAQLQQKMDEKFKKQFPERKKIEIVLTTTEWYRRERAANTICRAWRHYRTRQIQASEEGPVRTPSFRLREGLKNMAAIFGGQRARTPSRQESERSDQSNSNLNGSTMHLPLPFPFSRRSSRASSRGSHHSLDSNQGGGFHSASVILHSLMFPEADEQAEEPIPVEDVKLV
ncbi:unnamed protein product [Notodromas monacha]|uniref:Ion transport domain-containing protein n=1 Tax=Notodromas monacha TaxID=399045 RepID=A0A7R9BF92_9CRUS|nr:unnamed protein product [Notodromas monacha]CAG0913025.1 unnamed protein product [Notodromas monacha]